MPPESPNADGITSSFWFVTAFVLAIFVLVEGLLVAFLVRYRRRRRPRDADGAQIHGSSRLELAVDGRTGRDPVRDRGVRAGEAAGHRRRPGCDRRPGGRLEIEIVGQQFAWQYRYPNGVIAIDRLRAPVGRPVELKVTAPDWDVIHSWWIPALGGKIDAIPGRINHDVVPGDAHRRLQRAMRRAVRPLPREDARRGRGAAGPEFDAWLAARADAAGGRALALGQQEWEGYCAKCHGLDGGGGYGPPIAVTGADRRSRSTVHASSLRHGRGDDATRRPRLDEEQMDSLNAYLEERFGG